MASRCDRRGRSSDRPFTVGGTMSSGGVQIIVALIGVTGSLGVAYVTTGAAFESRLRENSVSVRQLRDSIRAVATQFRADLKRAEDDIAQLNATLTSAHSDVRELQTQVKTVGVQVQALHLNPALLQGLKTKQPQAKQ